MKKKIPTIDPERTKRFLSFHTFSSEKISKNIFKLYTTLLKDDGNFVMVSCEFSNGEFFNVSFWDREVIQFEIDQAIQFFKTALYQSVINNKSLK